MLAGCSTPSTQLVVVVDTDYAVPTGLASISSQVLDAAGAAVSTHDFTLTDVASPADPTRFALPLSFGVVPLDGDVSRRLTAVVQGRSAAGVVLVERRAVTGFVTGQRLRLPMFLAQACAGVACPADQTCTELGCQSETIAPDTLISVLPGEELGRDASVADAGAPTDGCVALTCLPDAGCDCAAGACCALTCADPSSCRAGCGGTCSVDARPTDSVDLRCRAGATCDLDARMTATAAVTCEAGSACVVDCLGSASCALDCQAGAACLLHCGAVPGCSLTCSAAGGSVPCAGMPGTLACGRSCL